MLLDQISKLPHLLVVIMVIAVAYLFSFVFRWIFFRLLRLYSSRVESILLESLNKRLKSPTFLLITFIVLYLFLSRLPLPQELITTLDQVLEILIIISAALMIAQLINVAQDVLFYRFDISGEDNLKARQARTQILFLKKVAIMVVVIIALSIVLLNFESVRKYGTTLLTSAGVAGIIIGFAAQKTISNLLAGFQIAFTQPIKIDDAVVVEGEWGWIEEINLTYVVVKIWDLRRLVLPITYFTDQPFQNWTRTSAQILGSVFIYTDYTLPVDALRKEFYRILENNDLWDGEGKSVQVTDTSTNSMTLRLLMTAKNSPAAWELRCLVREKLISWLQEEYPDCLPRTRAEVMEKANDPKLSVS